MNNSTNNNIYVGQVRPSQILWTYGPGSLIDLPNISVITMGLDFWKRENCTQINEARLLRAVQKVLGRQVKSLELPPTQQEEQPDFRTPEAYIGVPVRPFPRWLRCVKCGMLAEYDTGLFEIKENKYRPEQTHFVHPGCKYGKNSEAVPARFLMACGHGHIDDFPWRWFVHGGPNDCKGTLAFYESQASLQTENLFVQCSCGAKRSMAQAFGKEGQKNLPRCRGRHAHLNQFEQCEEVPRTILLGATNGWFPVSLSVLAIPTEKNELVQLITDAWEYFEDCESVDDVKLIQKTLVKSNTLPEIQNWSCQVLWEAIQDKINNGESVTTVEEEDIKIPEWNILTSTNPPSEFPHFLCKNTPVPEKYADKISSVRLLERLRKVNALLGFTRIEASNEFSASDDEIERAPLSKEPPTWIPACEVHGEGIFICFDEHRINEWENSSGVKKRNEKLLKGHQAWCIGHGLNPELGYPGIRYILLHTIAHLMIREFALECGYNAASIQERIYAMSDTKVSMTGILLYTAAADSDGTLGGLVELGKSDSLQRILELSLRRAAICSSDPLCSSHEPGEDRSLHGSACHSCAFVAETSCEAGNRYLDRALVVRTFDCKNAAFFESEGE